MEVRRVSDKIDEIYIEHAWVESDIFPGKREYIIVAYIAYGSGTVVINENKTEAVQKDIFVIKPGCRVQFMKNDENDVFEVHYICFNRGFLKGEWERYSEEFPAIESFFCDESVSFIIANDGEKSEIRNHIVRLINEYYENNPGRDGAVYGYMLILLPMIFRRHNMREEHVFSKNMLVDQTIRRIRGWIYINPKPGDIARNRHVSREYLGRVFKKETGMTITEYINNLRVSIIKDILKNTDRAIEDIPLLFNCRVKYIQQIFKKETGMTMRDYRKKHHYR